MARSKLILQAEDDELQRYLFNRAVNHLPVPAKLVTVHNGVEALEFLQKENNPTPDLIFLDVNMPYMTGLECLQEIREMEHLNNTKVIIYTTSEDETDKRTAIKYGASLYLIKDGDMRSLIRILLLLLNNQQEQLKFDNQLINITNR